MAIDAPFASVRGERSGLTPVGGGGAAALIGAMDGTLTNTIAIRREVESSAQDLRIVNERTQRMHSSFRDMEHQSKALMGSIADAITSTAEAVIDRLTPALDAAKASAISSAAAAAASHDAAQGIAAQGALSSLAINPLQRQTSAQGGIGPSGLGTAENPLVVTTADKQAPEATGASSQDVRKERREAQEVPEAERQTTVDRGKSRLPVSKADEGGELPPKPLNPYEMYQRGQGLSLNSIRQSFGRGIKHLGENWEAKLDTSDGTFRHPAGAVDKDGNKIGGQWASTKEISHYNVLKKVGRVARNYGGSIAEAETLGEGIGAALPGAAGPIGLAIAASIEAANMIADEAHKQREANNQFIAVEGGGQLGAEAERGRQKMFSLRERFTGGLDAAQSDELFMGATRIGLKGNEREAALSFGSQNYRKFGMDIASSLELINVAAQNGQRDLTGLSDALASVSQAAKDGGKNAEEARKQFTANYANASATFSNNNTAETVSAAITTALQRGGDTTKGLDASPLFSDPVLRQVAATIPGMDLGHLVALKGKAGGAEFNRDLGTWAKGNALRMLPDQAAFQRVVARVGKGALPGGGYSDKQIADLTAEVTRQGVDPAAIQSMAPTNLGVRNVSTSKAQATLAEYAAGVIDYGSATPPEDPLGINKKADVEQSAKDLGVRNLPGNLLPVQTVRQHLPWWLGGDHGSDNTKRDYLYQEKQTHTSSAIVEDLLKNYSADDRLRLSDGKTYTVQQAVHGHLAELEQGTAVFTNNDPHKKGYTIAEKAGFDKSTDPAAGKGVTGTIVLTLDPKAAQYFRAQTTGNVTNSNVPGDAHPPPDSRATGTAQ